MYEAFFKFNERPFAATPLVGRYFPAAAIESARQSLVRVVDRAEGAGLVVGPSGTGKTLLLQVLANDCRERFRPVLLSSGRMHTARALLQAILFDLNLPYRHMDEGELRLSLVDYIASAKLACDGLLLLIDEAQSMSGRLLDEVRMITNLVRDGEPRVRIVLAGSPKLEERFASPRLDSFAQRLAVRCYLESFTKDETESYVRKQVESSGGIANRLFANNALAAIYQATDGIPRLVNQLCDHTLLLASLGGHRTLSAEIVEEAWADLQQLPAPWNGSDASPTTGTRVIEFGGLDETSDDLPEAIPFPVGRKELTGVSNVEFGTLSEEDPAMQIDRLEAHLNEIDDGFRPAVSIRPEVELVFQGGKHPFGEEFTEEEVVIDRYASLEANVFEHSPLVSCPEGRELNERLAPLTRQAAEPIVQISAAKTAAAVAELRHSSIAIEDLNDDEDLIIVEEDAHPVIKPSPQPLARKQEYGQLFAKLRRG